MVTYSFSVWIPWPNLNEIRFKLNKIFLSLKCIWKYSIQNIGQFRQVSVCWMKIKSLGAAVIPISGIDWAHHMPGIINSWWNIILISESTWNIPICFRKLNWSSIVLANPDCFHADTKLRNKKNWGWRSVFNGLYITGQHNEWMYTKYHSKHQW